MVHSKIQPISITIHELWESIKFCKGDFFKEFGKRLPRYIVNIFIIWPIFSAFAAAFEVTKLPYFSLSYDAALLGSLAGIRLLIPDFIVVGCILLFLSLFIFSSLATKGLLRSNSWRYDQTLELGLLFTAILFGAALEWPAVLNHPILSPLQLFPVWMVTVFLCLMVLLGSFFLAAPGFRLRVFVVILTIGILTPLPAAYRGLWRAWRTPSSEPPLVLLGLDSLSQDDDLATLKKWSEGKNGTWYKRAVTPGLFTNSVWTSIVLMEPIDSHGIFYIFQTFPGLKEGETLIDKAHSLGYKTVSVFPDELTEWIGSHSGFDENRSGPVGWHQIATSHVENARLLLPLFRPLLPKLPCSTVPPNHAGTFTYDLDRELDEIFLLSSAGKRTFVAGHLTYLHSPIYPRYGELNRKDRLGVLRSPVNLVKDRSLDWQDIDLPDDNIQLRAWKMQRLQEVIISSLERTKFLERGGRLVIFSDHGNRRGLSEENFCQERYQHVLLLTFGLPRRDPESPISLIDVGSLLGLAPLDNANSFNAVEVVMPNGEEWIKILQSARLEKDGTVYFERDILKGIFKRLLMCYPWTDEKKVSHVFRE